MRKRHSFDRLFEGNIFVLFCVFFTVSMFVTAIFAGTFTVSIRSLIWTAFFISAPLLPLAVFLYLWRSNRIAERDYLFWVGIPVHYAVSSGLMLLFVFIQGLFYPLHRGVYLSALINYTVMYAIIIAGAAVIDLMQTAKANANLRKIQAGRGKDPESEE